MPPKRQSSFAGRKRGARNIELHNTDTKTAPSAVMRKRTAPETIQKSTTNHKRRKESPSIVNRAPDQRLDVYVFGTNSNGELGLGDASKKSEISKPTLNPKLPAKTVGVVQIAIGGVHSAALTYNNQILTWGVNDDGTLGRDTNENIKLTAIDATSDSSEDEDNEDDEVDLNLKEATPMPVDPSHFPSGTIFTQLVATDSATFVLTAEGLVYGWGTFRDDNGSNNFSPEVGIQHVSTLVPGVHHVTNLVAGAQHVLALTSNGTVYSWGRNEQNQLGRRLNSRLNTQPGLVPGQCALPRNIVDIGAGQYHSFAIQKNGMIYGWGSNNFGQTGIFKNAGQSDATVLFPTKVESLKQANVTAIAGGKDHSLALTDQGHCLTWGRIDNKALGLVIKDIPPSNTVYDTYGRPRILKTPTRITDIDESITFVTAGTDHSIAITKEGKAYSWGFNSQKQTGHPAGEEIEKPTRLENEYVSGKYLVSAAAGGQFGMVFGQSEVQANGKHE